MTFDEKDIQILNENFNVEMIAKIKLDNASMIFKYLEDNGIYYAKDLFLMSLDLFLLPYDDFVNRFEKLKNRLGYDYVDKLGNDSSLIEIMYDN